MRLKVQRNVLLLTILLWSPIQLVVLLRLVLPHATTDQQAPSTSTPIVPSELDLLIKRYPLESQDPYLRLHLSYFCRTLPCIQSLPDIYWPPIRFLSIEQRELFLKFKKVKDQVEVFQKDTEPHLLRTELLLLPHRMMSQPIDCGWGTRHEEFLPIPSEMNATFHKAMPLTVPEGEYFQHFVDGVLPKLMMHLDVILDHQVTVAFTRPPRDRNIQNMLSRIGIEPMVRVVAPKPSVLATELYSGCLVPPLHPLLWRRARALLVGRVVPPQQTSPAGVAAVNGTIILVKRSSKNTRNPGRLVNNYDELKQSLLEEYGDRLVEFDSKLHSFESTVDLWSSASAVVASHGGALTNLIFCPEGATVIEVMPTRADGTIPLRHPGMMFYVFSGLLGLNYWRIQSVGTDKNVVINAQEVVQILNDPLRRSEADLVMSAPEKACLHTASCATTNVTTSIE